MSEVDSQSRPLAEDRQIPAPHSLAPWFYEPDRDEAHTEKDRYDRCSAGSIVDSNGTIICRMLADADDIIPNATLMAAAPDLAVALRRALSWLSSYQGNGAKGAYMDAVNALKKAGCYD